MEPHEAVVIKPFSDMTLLPPAPHLCQACAVKHDPGQPHNQQSFHYQYWFRLQEAKAGREERWPTWSDAMAHCTPEVQQAWREELAKHGVEVP